MSPFGMICMSNPKKDTIVKKRAELMSLFKSKENELG